MQGESGCRPWMLVAGSTLLGWGILNIGFRILYDDVIPEVALIVASGFVLGVMNRPTRAGLALIGLAAGMVLSRIVLPVAAPAAHVVKYGLPHPPSILDRLRLLALPTVGILAGVIVRAFARFSLRADV